LRRHVRNDGRDLFAPLPSLPRPALAMLGAHCFFLTAIRDLARQIIRRVMQAGRRSAGRKGEHGATSAAERAEPVKIRSARALPPLLNVVAFYPIARIIV
jgi:hypothetical protein